MYRATSLFYINQKRHPSRKVMSSVFLTLVLLAPWISVQAQRISSDSHNLRVEGPAFLTQQQALDDIHIFEQTLQRGYSHFEVFQEQEGFWDTRFEEIQKHYHTSQTQYLTHQLLKHLTALLQDTKDASFAGQVKVHKRIYEARVLGEHTPFYSELKFREYQGRYRVLPNDAHEQLSNLWFRECSIEQGSIRFFPILPERLQEHRFILGLLGDLPPEPLECVFENDVAIPTQVVLSFHRLQSSQPNQRNTPWFEWDNGVIPYVRWYREGDLESREGRQFLEAAMVLEGKPVLILDVRDNRTGSFATVQKWFQRITRAQWQHVILQERQNAITAQGHLNRLYWRTSQPKRPDNWDDLNRSKRQLQVLLNKLKYGTVASKWVETKFLFQGQPGQAPWNKVLIVIANQNCGAGCQFLAALAKQLPNALLLGEPTGPYPRPEQLPLYQLPNSKILMSINAILHRDAERTPVGPAGYEPDFWLEPTDSVSEVISFTKHFLQQVQNVEEL